VQQVSDDLVLDSQLKLCYVSQLPALLIKLSLFLVSQAHEISLLLQ